MFHPVFRRLIPILCSVCAVPAHQADVDNFQEDYPGCTQIEGNVYIVGDNISNLNGLRVLTSVGENPSLSNLEGLINLTYLGNQLIMYTNPSLLSLSGLDNIGLGAGNGITLANNDTLSGCDLQSICYFINNFGSNAHIYNNEQGCNSIQQVAAACGVLSLEEMNESISVQVFPNPFPATTTITCTLSESAPVIMQIYNLQGIQMDNITGNLPALQHLLVWNAEKYSPGIYFFRITAGSQVLTGRLLLIK